MDEDRLALRLQLAEAGLGLAISLWLLWTMVPEHRRQELKMRLLTIAQQMSQASARRIGEVSMGIELATGEQAYQVPLFLSRCSEAIGRAYRGMTP
jgi:hypothetical protein